MSDSEYSDQEAPIEISMKKPLSSKQSKQKQSKIALPHRKITKKQQVREKNLKKLKSEIYSSLKKKIEEQKIEKQLQNLPLNFGPNEAKVIKIEQKKSESKKIKNLGIEVVHQAKRNIRKPVNYMEKKLQKCAHLRADLEEIQIKKAVRK